MRIGVGQAQLDSIESEQRRTDRDFRAELLDRFRNANEDSARLVFGVLALAVDRTVFPVDTLHDWLFTADSILQGLAVKAAGSLLFERGSPPPMPLEQPVADSIVDRLLGYLIDGASVWPSFWDSEAIDLPFADRSARTRSQRPRISGVPASLVEKYRDRADIMVPGQTETSARSQGARIWIERVAHHGPFVRVRVSAAGSYVWNWVLVKVGDAWRIVARFDLVI